MTQGYLSIQKKDKDKIINEMAEAFMALIQNDELRKRLGNNGYQYVNTEFTWDKMVEKVYSQFTMIKK